MPFAIRCRACRRRPRQRHPVAGDCGRHAIDQTDEGADQRRARARDSELTKRQGRAARQKPGNERTDDTGPAVKRRQPRGQTGKGGQRIDGQREQQSAEEAEADDAENDTGSKHGGSP
jgi:hypothetical protein